ncbi:major facilitator superfamily MFS_1, partial [gut metagenome]
FFFGYLVVFALICAIGMPLAIGLDGAGVFYTPIAKSLHTSSGITSYYTSFLWGVGLVTLPFMGKLLDHVDSRIVVAGSCLLITLDFLWLSFITTIWEYFVAALIMGLGRRDAEPH